MIRLFQLIKEKDFLIKKYKYLIFEEKRKLHKQFISCYKKWCVIADILFVLALLMNFGAVMLTNFMVAKDIPQDQLVLHEVNPVQAELNNFKIHPLAYIIAAITLFHWFCWFTLVMLYLYYRMNLLDLSGLYLVYAIVAFLIIFLGMDFFNNLGYFVGWAVAG